MNNTIQTDSIMNGLPKCTLCGEPATCMIRNYSREIMMNGRYRHEPVGEPEYRCKTHGVSTVYNITSLYDPPSENTIENKETV